MAGRRVGRVLVIAALTTQLGAGQVVVGTPQALAAASGRPVTTGPGAAIGSQDAGGRGSPAAQARASGQRIEVAELATPTTQVFANPDGTYTMEQHAQPVRARKGSSWVPIDTTLRFGVDGMVAPAAGAVAVSFSGGGDAPLVRLADGDNQLALDWPGALPRPELDRDTATYREVLPGVDLRMRATSQGYRQVLVVKNRAAARDPRLARLSFGLKTAGVSVRRTGPGLVAVDRAGREVFQAGQPRMWDAGSRQAGMTVELDADSLTVIPDRKLLTAEDAKFPLEIDPDFNAGRTAWALVYGIPGDYAGQSYWFGDGDNAAKVGYSSWDVPVVLARSYFQFDVAPLFGKHILGAEFNAFEWWSPSCEARDVELYETGAINPGTTWNSQPWIGQKLGSQLVAAGYDGVRCPGRSLGFPAGSAVTNSVNNRWTTTTLMLRAGGDERDPKAWKKFDPNSATLIVHFNSYPNVPAGLSAEGQACGTTPNQAYLGVTGPNLRTTASDPDGGNVAVKFEWFLRNGAKRGETTTLNQPSGTQFQIKVPDSAYKDGETLAWHAQTFDGLDWSAWSNWCEATVDRTSPDKAPMVKSTDYPERDLGGGIGRTGTFTFSANGVGDVQGYLYDLHDQPKRYVAANAVGGSATVLITPPSDGSKALWVRSQDKAGNLGPIYRYEFFVGAGTPPVGYWRLDGYQSAAEAPDGSGRGHDGTVTGIGGNPAGARWTAGRQDDALAFDGGYVATTGGPAVRTDGTFAVVAWARTDVVDDKWRTLVSEDGEQVSGFYLQVDPVEHKWNFTMLDSDSSGAPRRSAVSNLSAITGRWTHLVGTYERSTGELALYVDGVKQGRTATQSTPWPAIGPVQIGRAKFDGGSADSFKGAVDDVRLYDRLLSAEEIRELANAVTDEGFWPLDEGTGTTAGDVSGNRRDVTLHGGATWTPVAAVGDSAVRLDGRTGTLDTGVAAIRAGGSLTVSAYALLDSANDRSQALVSQDGGDSSGFALGYDGPSKHWIFALALQDRDNPPLLIVTSAEAAQPGEWTELTGVYDAAAQKLLLYVNGAIAGSTPVAPGTLFLWPMGGDVVVGRGKLNGVPVSYWGGGVDHVRLYTGARSVDEIRADYRTPPTDTPSAYTGQFSRWVDHFGDHLVSNGEIPRGYHYESPLGYPAPADAPNTRMLYSCLAGTDEFESAQADCEGQHVLGELGPVYVSAPADVPTTPLYRCRMSGDHFVSLASNCEREQVEGLLGYARIYSSLIRYRQRDGLGEHRSSAQRMPATYEPEGSLGIISRVGLPGTVALRVCQDGTDTFSSTDPGCEGKAVVETTGSIWTAPPSGMESVPLLRCQVIGSTGNVVERFDSTDAGCEGQRVEKVLGYVVVRL
ncbi:LamG-like jellyroll fold domain-containing protein [Micromonospora sp. NPDC049559]|uniref:LamG-like jellyroll fold domain-containing protein n=1 Tax=Micromonospora sp. NPDC049559 TaxID=3155923 RepID=UPI003439B210